MTDFIEYYKHYDEDGRLERHPTEFFVTTFLLDSLISPTAVILDVAGGTGKYAFYYAEKGHSVTLRDAVKKHIDLAQESISRLGIKNVCAKVGDARDLRDIAAKSHDVVLFMGPAYHLWMQELRIAIAESLRVLKNKGILVVAYVNQYDGWKDDKYTGHLIFRSGEEMLKIMGFFPLELLYHIATDGPVYQEVTELLEGDCGDGRRCHGWMQENHRILRESIGLEACIHGLMVAQNTQ